MTQPLTSCWLTAAEIAERRLPGLPADKRSVNALASDRAWARELAEDGTPLARRRAARGGATEYHASLLPEPAQEALSRIAEATPIAANDTGNADAEAWERFDRQPATVKAAAQKRLAILLEAERLIGLGSLKTAAIATAAKQNGVSARAIHDWLREVSNLDRHHWLPRLAPKYKGGGKQVQIHPKAWEWFKSDYLRLSQPSASACYNRMVEQFTRPAGIEVPHLKTFKRRLERDMRSDVIIRKRQGKEALRQSTPPIQRTIADLRAMELVNVDGHKFDIWVRTEDNRIIRPIIVGIQDVYSRKMLAYRIGETESTQLVRLAFYDLFRKWGLPGEVYMDNGRAFAGKAMTGGVKTRFRFKINLNDALGVLPGLGIDVHWTLPYRGQSKPIERAWRDLCCEYIAKHPAMEGAYTGNKPDAKPENYRSRAIPMAEFLSHVERQFALHNARSGRRTEAARGASFDAAFTTSYENSVIPRASQEQLRLALLEPVERVCDRKHGAVSVYGNVYHSEELLGLRGKKVDVRFDPDDLHGAVDIYFKDGRYLCSAPAVQKYGFKDKEGAIYVAKREQNAKRSARKAVDDQQLWQQAQWDAAFASADSVLEPEPRPKAGAIRMARHRHSAAALKPIEQAEDVSAEPSFIDKFVIGTGRLRPVE